MSINKIQDRLEFLNNTVYIKQDASNNLSFTDGIAGTKTLTELLSGDSHIQNTDYMITKTTPGVGYQSSQVTNGFSSRIMAAFAYEATATEYINEVTAILETV